MGYPLAEVLDALFTPNVYGLGFGLFAPLLLPLSVLGLWQVIRRGEHALFTAFIIGCAVSFAATLSQATLWGLFARASARFLTPTLGTALILSSLVSGRMAAFAWLLITLNAELYAIPVGWSSVDLRAVTQVGAAGLLATVAIMRIRSLCIRYRSRPAILLALSAIPLVVLCAYVANVRLRSRYDTYAAAAERRAFDANPILYASSWPIWQALDSESPHRIALTAGWDGVGHNWYSYPLLGSRLQNEVFYVSPTRDGRPLDYSLEPDSARAVSFAAWVTRLTALHIDTIVMLDPLPPVEASWIREHPELFQPSVCSQDGLSCAYQFQRDPLDSAATP